MVTPKGHGREITMFNPCTGISLSGSALERHSIVSRNVNLHRCQAQDIISNGKLWMGQITDASNVYIYIYVSRDASDRPRVTWNEFISISPDYLSRRDCIFPRPVISQIAHFPKRAKSQTYSFTLRTLVPY